MKIKTIDRSYSKNHKKLFFGPSLTNDELRLSGFVARDNFLTNLDNSRGNSLKLKRMLSDSKIIVPQSKRNARKSNDHIDRRELPKIREKFNSLIGDINQYQNGVTAVSTKVSDILSTKPEFQSMSFEKYVQSKFKAIEASNKLFNIGLTLKNCNLNDSAIQLERFGSPQPKFQKLTHLYIKDENLNLNQKSAVPIKKSKDEKNISNNKKKDLSGLLGNTFKNVLSNVKMQSSTKNIRSSLNASTLQKQMDTLKIKEKIISSQEVFKKKFNQKLLKNIFFFHIKSNKKASIEKILQMHPVLSKEPDQFGRYPLHYSVSRDMFKMTKILIGCGSPIEAMDNQGNRPLDNAYAANNVRIIKVKLLAPVVQSGKPVHKNGRN